MLIKNLPSDVQIVAYEKHKEQRGENARTWDEFLKGDLSMVFKWGATPERHKYWQNLNEDVGSPFKEVHSIFN